MTVDQIRRANLLLLIDEAGSQAKLHRVTGVPAAYISQTSRGVEHSTGKKSRSIGCAVARRLEDKMGKPRGWMDTDHSALHVSSDLTGREGQLVGLFRILNDLEQVALIEDLTRRLRAQARPSPDVGPSTSATH